MKSWGNRDAIITDVTRKLLAAREGNYPFPDLPDNLTNWLAQLTLLYGVPVEYMVADNRMLPLESMRFFYIDRNWLDRLVDGALSVGVLSSREQVFNETFYEDIYAQIDVRQMQLRANLRNETPPAVTAAGGGMTGVIFRSAVVSGWPGLEIEAYKDKVLLRILRMDRLSDNTMLCIWEDLPDTVNFIEPSEGLHFGVIMDPGADTFKVYLRGLGYPTTNPYPAGEQIFNGPDPVAASGGFRSGVKGVIDIAGLKNNITKAMPAGALPDGKLSPGAMAIQMVRGAGKQPYDMNSPACEGSISQP
ncbi:hypothetical protein SIO70_24020 [Chitinophaga sancti]|uniref:hypothetical protein n=1 Tax=Chitinophaga sancti TaxID=1004 RepID=UPI002A759C14|nr:hypothetical protein [Chitinophaga sancti]WPQ61431.1 hypothetical protein SIO70_24020 [Chitinophaga sancti]